ncbi:MAG: bifunctional pyr operon transcriptional regulator/uracil phosphoribosyltransferase PyrR [Polyangiales bacterium]
MGGGTADNDALLDGATLGRVTRRMASSIVEELADEFASDDVALVGIRRGGIGLSLRLASEVKKLNGKELPVGAVDIAFYRDDAATALPDPRVGPSDVQFGLQGKTVIIVDDVLQTGRTIRAALECLNDYGRPRRVLLAVLFDRGGRELPIAADFIGRELTVAPGRRVDVRLGATPADDDGAFIRGSRG